MGLGAGSLAVSFLRVGEISFFSINIHISILANLSLLSGRHHDVLARGDVALRVATDRERGQTNIARMRSTVTTSSRRMRNNCFGCSSAASSDSSSGGATAEVHVRLRR